MNVRKLARRHVCLSVFAFVSLVAAPSFATGISLTITPNAVYSSSIQNCKDDDGVGWAYCGTNAFLSSSVATSITNFMQPDTFGGGQTLPGGSPDFAAAYDSWFLGPDSSGWGPLDNGTLAGSLTLNVDVFHALACTSSAGLGQTCVPGLDSGINVVLQNYQPGPGDPNLDQLFWVQGVITNYAPGTDGTSTIHETMDTSTLSNLKDCALLPLPHDSSTPAVRPNSGAGDAPYCGPAYPYQYGDKSFSDSPFGPYTNGSFRGIALLATETSGLDGVNTLTVYGGVNYGFDNFATDAPEPGTWLLCFAGVGVIVLRRRGAAGCVKR
jgi:hypothetical protein